MSIDSSSAPSILERRLVEIAINSAHQHIDYALVFADAHTKETLTQVSRLLCEAAIRNMEGKQ